MPSRTLYTFSHLSSHPMTIGVFHGGRARGRLKPPSRSQEVGQKQGEKSGNSSNISGNLVSRGCADEVLRQCGFKGELLLMEFFGHFGLKGGCWWRFSDSLISREGAVERFRTIWGWLEGVADGADKAGWATWCSPCNKKNFPCCTLLLMTKWMLNFIFSFRTQSADIATKWHPSRTWCQQLD